MTDANTTPLCHGCSVEPSPDLRSLDGGRILIGGAPLTILRLSAHGAELVTRWFAGIPIGDDGRHHALARRLEANGMGHLRWPRPGPAPTTVVIPVKDDAQGLALTLSGLLRPEPGAGPGELSVIVVDDGSRQPVTSHDARVSVVRSPSPSGPGQARQRALERVSTETVAFIDAGVSISRAELDLLTDHLADPAVVAVAPRVLSAPTTHLSGRYDRRRSPLDLGSTESTVGPTRTVPYVPTACLVARTEAVRATGGFDPGLRYGEDVDLVWRLGAIGIVRYAPEILAQHQPRSSLTGLVGQRFSYGSAAAPLAIRHGDAVAPCRLSPWSLLVFGLAALGHPVAAIAAGSATAVALKPKIEPLPDATIVAFILTARGHWYGSLSVLTAAVRSWSPLLIAAMAVVPSRRRRLVALIAAAFGRRLLDGPRRPGPAALDLAVGVVDDLAYCAGVWRGVLRARSAAALKPTLTSWPKPRLTRR